MAAEPVGMISCRNAPFGALAGKEWIVTNGIGGYASSSICCANTRRYHGLLVASFNPPTERMVLLSKTEETIFHNKQDHHLSCNEYGDTVHPEGFQYLASFSRSPLPEFHYGTKDWALRKSVFMVYGSNTTVIEYENTSASTFLLKISPLFVYRDYHSLLHELPNFDFQLKRKKDHLAVFAYYGADPLFFRFSRGRFIEKRYWNKNLTYRIDRERGQSHHEDNYCLGLIEEELAPGEKLWLTFTMDEAMMQPEPQQLKESELQRLSQLLPRDIQDPWLKDLLVAGDQFIVQRRSTDNYSVIAGYHWFTDWGRDSMIAIRGLCIASGRQDIARSVLLTFLSYLRQGIIPNRFPDYKGELAEYNTADATLWLFVALYEYDQAFADTDLLRQIYPQLGEIIVRHLEGTLHNIRVREDGLLSQGAPNVQLTWMDARIGNVVFTPREGCPVEINALWYNALCVYEHVCARLNVSAPERFVQVKEIVGRHFISRFWNRNGYLNDVVTATGSDPSLRPNQVYAVSLPFSPLSNDQARSVVDAVKAKLLTPYGLRTLDPGHKDFKTHYTGDVWARDAAYHQGTVWPFLLPEYFFALLKVHGDSEQARQEVAAGLAALKEHFYQRECIHGVSEIFDGLDPSQGKGCAHQAWSVSNIILLLLKTGIRV